MASGRLPACFFGTGLANVNFLGGQFTGSYLQSDVNNPVVDK